MARAGLQRRDRTGMIGPRQELNTQSDLSFCPCSVLHQRLQPTRLRPLTRLEHEQKSGVISVYFILVEALTGFPFQPNGHPE